MAGMGSPYMAAIGGAGGAPGLAGPPPPTGIGAMDSGDALTPRAQAQAAIMAIRKLGDAFPSMADRVDGMIEEIKAATSDSAKPTAEPMPGDTPPPAAPPAALPPLPLGGAGGGAPPGLPPLPM